MPILRHLLVALIYAMVAAAVAIALPRLVPSVGMETGLTIGGALLLAFALLHEIFSRQEQQSRLAEEIQDLRLSHGDVMRELNLARGEVGGIHEALAGFKGARVSQDFQKDFDHMVSEVRMLQNLVTRLTAPPAHAADEAADHGFQGPIDRTTPAVDASRAVAPGADGLNDNVILHIIQEGLKRDRVDLVLQPIVSLPQRKRKFLEAFTRIRADDGSIIVPEQYIGIAEREGLITAIDNMLLFRCVQLLRKTHGRNRNVGYFCNISPYTLADHMFFQECVEFMSENAGLAPNLIFELSQATVASRDAHIMRQLSRLARLGFRFSMDQVASLNLDYAGLAEQNFKFVKIEAVTLLREFTSPNSSFDVSIQDLKRTLERQGIDLIVEKIESEPMLLEILDFQIDFGQGYLFGEPKFAQSA